MDFSLITTETQLFDYLIELFQNNILNENISILKDSKICILGEYKDYIIKLLKYSFLTYDFYTDSRLIINKKEIITRSNLLGFIKKDIVDKFSKSLSKQNIIVGLHDHLSDISYLYKDGKKRKWNKAKIVISYEIFTDKWGNPSILDNQEKLYIFDYGSNIYELSDLLNNNKLKETIINNYVEVSIINSNFNIHINLLHSILKILEQIY